MHEELVKEKKNKRERGLLGKSRCFGPAITYQTIIISAGGQRVPRVQTLAFWIDSVNNYLEGESFFLYYYWVSFLCFFLFFC